MISKAFFCRLLYRKITLLRFFYELHVLSITTSHFNQVFTRGQKLVISLATPF